MNLLSDNPDIGSFAAIIFAAIINEPIEAEAVVEMAEQRDFVLKPKIGPAPATAKAASATVETAKATVTARPEGAVAAPVSASGRSVPHRSGCRSRPRPRCGSRRRPPCPRPRCGSRRAGSNQEVLRAIIETCALTCRACAEECEKHAGQHEHCKVCAAECRSCEQACT